MTSDQSSLDLRQILGVITEIAQHIHPGLDLEQLLNNSAQTVLHRLQTDRVVIYQFLAGGDGLIAVEAVQPPWQSILGELIYDPCFETGWAETYRQGRFSAVHDIYTADLETCYVELMARFQVRANLVVPVFCEGQLWGLLIAHHCAGPRVWQPLDLELVQQVALHLGMAIDQRELRSQLHRAQERLKTELAQRTEVLHTYQRRLGDITAVLRQASAAIAQMRVYPDGQQVVDYRSEGCLEVFGFTAEELLNQPALWRSRMVSEDAERLFAELSVDLQTAETTTLEYRFLHRDGSLRWIVDTFASFRDDAADCWRVTALAIDATARKAAELALCQRIAREQLLRQITAHIRQSLDLDTILATTVREVHNLLQADRTLIFRLLPDGDGLIIQECVQPAYPVTEAMRFVDEWFAQDCYEFYLQGQARIVPDVAQDEWASCIADFMQVVRVKSKMVAPIVEQDEVNSISVWGLLIVHACADYRQWQPSEAELLQQIADQMAIAIQQSEFYQQLQQLNQELSRLSITDALTQVANRRRFDAYLRQEWQRLLREQQPITLILCDVDYFKGYNDTYGHAQGDQCLIAIAEAIQGSIQRPADLVARYGGEEFVVILPDTDSQGGVQVVQLIQQRLGQLQLAHGASLISRYVTLSYGIASLVPSLETSPDQLLQQADRALYQAKDAGRDCYSLFIPSPSPPDWPPG